MRVEPAPSILSAPGGAPAGGRQGGGAPGGGRGAGAVPGVPAPMPPSGSDPVNPCGGGAGGGGGFGGGGANLGPWVLPGTYNVALMVDGKAAGTKSMRVVLDPANQLSDVQRKRYTDIVMDLHQLQTRGVEAARAMMPFHTQMTDIAGKIGGMANVPEAVKTQFAAVQKEWDTVRAKFGVPPAVGPAGGGRGGGFGGGAPVNNTDVVGRAGNVKGQIMAFYDMPSTSLMNQYNDVRLALPRVIAELNTFLAKANGLSQALAKSGVTLTVPAPVK